ncbi:MAG: hypothetical protein R2844_12690 [Caldilineales bacterium]
MIGFSKETTLTPPEVLDTAVRFFGEKGVGLEVSERDNCCARFDGAGGHVYVHVVEKDDKTAVNVDSREWDYQAREFLDYL